MEFNEADATNDLIAEMVVEKNSRYMRPQHFAPLDNGSDDLLILKVVKEWLNEDDSIKSNGRYNVFYNTLSETLRSRDPYYRDTVNGFNLYYMDQYRVGDFARAAFAAVTVGDTLSPE